MSETEPLKENIRENMFHEMADKSIFNQAKEYAYDYADKSFERNVYPTQDAIDGLSIFDEELPEHTNNPANILEQLHKYGSPATVSQIGGRYFGLVNGGIIPTALAAKWLTDFWDQNTPLFISSPIVSKLESVVEKWLIQIFNLPDKTVAGFVSGSSMAILCGLAAARFRILKRMNWDVNAKGLYNAPKIRIVAGMQAHGTVLKAIAILGLGKDNVEFVDVDDQGRIISEKMPALDENTLLILQAGNVNTGSFDNFNEICDKAVTANAWIHIDGAFGLWAAGSKNLSHLTKGIEKANSWSVDGHKTLNTPYDCGIVLCNDIEALVSALQATGSYIVYGNNRDGMLYTPEMSRRARIVELWASLKYLGQN
jgi:glutamate/tyrosine decarboxylase-like PLP-dependent enzyme